MLKKIALALVLTGSSFAGAHAATITPDSIWYSFDIDEAFSSQNNLEWIDLNGDALSFDFNLTHSSYLTIVDGGFAGDRFKIFDNGNLLGETSVASQNYPESLGLDFDAALADNRYSKRTFLLSAGNHSITGLLSSSAYFDQLSPINATVGGVRLAPVPVPSAAWLFISGGVSLWLRRRHS